MKIEKLWRCLVRDVSIRLHQIRQTDLLSQASRMAFVECFERQKARLSRAGMLFYSFFKTLHGKEVVVELKNDLAIRGVCVFVAAAR